MEELPDLIILNYDRFSTIGAGFFTMLHHKTAGGAGKGLLIAQRGAASDTARGSDWIGSVAVRTDTTA